MIDRLKLALGRRLIKKIPGQVVYETIKDATGLIHISEHSPNDVFIAGYPKSGNTWCQHLIAAIVYGLDPETSRDKIVTSLVPDVHAKPFYKRFSDVMFFKSHFLPREDYRRVVYLVRDGRDVMTSYYFANTNQYGESVDFMSMVRDGKDIFPCKWHEHVEAWLANPHGAEMISIKYEDLKNNPVPTFRKFCDFIGVERDDSFLKNVAEKSTFEIMRKKEIQFGWDNPKWPKDKPFVRRGKVGSFKDEMPPDVLKEFMAQSENAMKLLGYI